MPGTNLTRLEAQTRAATVQTESYVVELDLSTTAPTFRSITEVRFSAQPGAETFIDLIAPRVNRIELNGNELDPETHFADSRIQLPDLAAQNVLIVDADCAYMNTGEGLHRFTDPEDGEIYLYSQFEVADTRRVFAVFEQPDLKASFEFKVTAPDHWHVISNNPGQKKETPGTVEIAGKTRSLARWEFTPTVRIPCYVTAVVAGPYHEVVGTIQSRKGTIGANVYCRQALATYLDADVVLADTQQGFDFYEEKFQLAYPFEKYDQIFVPEFNAGAMENAGCVTFLEDYVFRSKTVAARVERRTVTILHELAHMWFGDLVTMQWWDDLWLNESFAEFMSTLVTAERTKWTNSWVTFNSLEKSWAYRQDQLPSTHPIVADINDLEDVEVNFDGITYAKGASVLRQLVAWVGEDAFFAGVAEYFRKHQFGNTTLRDLMTELEKTSGRELISWAEVWLEKAGVNTIYPEFETAADGTFTKFSVRQEAPAAWPTLRPHRLGIGVYQLQHGALTRTFFTEVDIADESTQITELIGQSSGDLVLLNDGDLAYTKIRLDDASLATALAHINSFTDPLARSIVLAAAWDMTRDGQLSARKYVDLVLSCIGNETESTVTMMLIRQLLTTITLYVHPSESDRVAIAAADKLWDLAVEAAAGSDNQLQFVKATCALARTPAQLDKISAILHGEDTLPGLSVDADLAWDLVIALVAGGRFGEADIEKQLAADATASGHRRAAHARAAIPGTAAKQAAWDLLINAPEGEDLPNALQFETTAGFNNVRDVASLAAFVPKYFAAVRRIYETKTNEMATNLIEGLYPLQLAGRLPELTELADAWLQQNSDAHPALRRLIIEGNDNVHRALQAQAKDSAE